MSTSLEALAWVAASSGRPELAALLPGARAALWDELGNHFLPYEQGYHHSCEAAARAGLDQGRYRACWEKRYALGRSQAIAAALEEEGTVPAVRAAPAATAAGAFELSARELEVARLVADRLSNPAIASALFVSLAPVKTHVSHILAKLGLDCRTQLARWVAPTPSAPCAGPPAAGRLHRIIPRIGRLADGTAPAGAQDRTVPHEPGPRRTR